VLDGLTVTVLDAGAVETTTTAVEEVRVVPGTTTVVTVDGAATAVD